MATTARATSRATAPPTRGAALPGPGQTPPRTTEEYLKGIEVMGERIHVYVRFMCQVGSLNGTSAEAKDRAVTAFYERLVVMEGQLGRIHDDLRLE